MTPARAIECEPPRPSYEKTGARRQADLVKLVAGFSNSFLP